MSADPLDIELAFLAEAHANAALSSRLAIYREAILSGRPAPLTSEELVWAGRIAWRNHAKCVGRLYWRTLTVRDLREVNRAEDIAAALRDHVTSAQANGTIRSIMSVFAPSGADAPRIWNHQLCAYAGYREKDGIAGDPKNVA